MNAAAIALIALQSQPDQVDWKWKQVSIFLIILIVIVVAGVGGWWINRKWGKTVEGQGNIEEGRRWIILGGFVLTAFLLVVGAGFVIYGLVTKGTLPDQPEVLMGLVIVTAIAALMTLLFILAAGFSFMKLTDPKQALGLPEGSIRAMIALILIMIFIIFGIYTFRVVSEGIYTKVEAGMTTFDVTKYAGKDVFVEHQEDGTYNVFVGSEVSEDGARLAQQLLTTVGTLVVAVAGFYFGSTAVSSAVAAVQGATTAPNPTLTDVSPKEGKQGETIAVEIAGTDFKSPKTVQLVRGAETISGTGILSSTTMIRCSMTLDKEPGGDKWDVVVENEDGKQARKDKVFTINPAG